MTLDDAIAKLEELVRKRNEFELTPEEEDEILDALPDLLKELRAGQREKQDAIIAINQARQNALNFEREVAALKQQLSEAQADKAELRKLFLARGISWEDGLSIPKIVGHVLSEGGRQLSEKDAVIAKYATHTWNCLHMRHALCKCDCGFEALAALPDRKEE